MEDQSTSNNNLSENCFVCKVSFDRNLKKSRRRIWRERDDLLSPFLYLLYFANKSGTWFSQNEMQLNYTPFSQQTTQTLQQMFSCRKCFEKVIKLERDLKTFEKDVSSMLDESFETLMAMNIISGDKERMQELKCEQEKVKQVVKKTKRVVAKRKKGRTSQRKKKKVETQVVAQQQQQQQQHVHQQKTKQILVLAKAPEGDQQQLLLLQMPVNDSENENSYDSQTMIATHQFDHEYTHDGQQAVYFETNIPVTNCVTVTSDDHQVLEVQIEQDTHDNTCEIEEGRNEETERRESVGDVDETLVAVNAIAQQENAWNVGDNGNVTDECVAKKRKKRKAETMPDEDNEDSGQKEIDFDADSSQIKDEKPFKSQRNKRTYAPRSSSPLPPSGESKIVVHLMYGSKQWKRTMEGDLKSIIRDMALGRFEPAGRKIAASEQLCASVVRNYSKRLVTECKEAARTIRVADHQDITQLDLKSFTNEVFSKCDKTANLIKSLIPIEPRDTLDEHAASSVIMGIILYMHSMQSNMLQHILSYVLRKAGCNREGFKTLHSLGLTLSYTSILKVMNDIDAKPDFVEKSSLDTIEKSIENVVFKHKVENERQTRKKGHTNSVDNSDSHTHGLPHGYISIPFQYQQTYSADNPTTTTITYADYNEPQVENNNA